MEPLEVSVVILLLDLKLQSLTCPLKMVAWEKVVELSHQGLLLVDELLMAKWPRCCRLNFPSRCLSGLVEDAQHLVFATPHHPRYPHFSLVLLWGLAGASQQPA
jgi:hypothetical protein